MTDYDTPLRERLSLGEEYTVDEVMGELDIRQTHINYLESILDDVDVFLQTIPLVPQTPAPIEYEIVTEDDVLEDPLLVLGEFKLDDQGEKIEIIPDGPPLDENGDLLEEVEVRRESLRLGFIKNREKVRGKSAKAKEKNKQDNGPPENPGQGNSP
jgi:hypothetical protein